MFLHKRGKFPHSIFRTQHNWDSSALCRKERCIVRKGKILALALASALLAAALPNGEAWAREHVYVEDVRADTGYVDMIEGDTFRVGARVYPDDASDKDVYWRSDNPYVASVDGGGLITANNPGFANISVQTHEFGYIDYVGVQVRQNTTPVTSISIAPATLQVLTGTTGSMKAVVLPERAADKSVIWDVEDPGIAFVNEVGTVYGVSEGTTHVWCWSASSGLMAEAVVRVIEASKDPAYLYAETQLIMMAAPGGVANMTASLPMTFSKSALNAMKLRPDVQLLLTFPYKERTYSVAIPGGYDLSKLMDDDGYVSWADIADCGDKKIIVQVI